ncbi:sugar O-acyltransferase, sialic acid O-acetyltransferase NeuD family [Paenibacillus sp. UNC496MF]|uniref:acetyltransferase n=1 Tax=Paenibacillus sp. UNC496MF TaxID=1502753 RepID=UPI0008EC5029|nr:acetyltransferase [Paenibacillus sp. UNC496MF]SFI38869.1 sugar O-acyltransferase, sialic acid O-acetyltransferase NeuD family [Paenibacillus sp. UNC496MF]
MSDNGNFLRGGIVIWGAGGHARETLWLCEELGAAVLGFLDERPEAKGGIVEGLPILGTLADIEGLRDEALLVCAGVGDPALKRRFAEETVRAGFRAAPPLIHPRAAVNRRTRIGDGSVIFEGCSVSGNVAIGEHVIVNRCASISHDAVIEAYATIAPGVRLAGNVFVGEGAYVGIGASVREKRRIGRWSVVGGGAFVKDDVPERTMAAGVPAEVKKRLDREEGKRPE